MGVNKTEWCRFDALRKVVGATNREDRWSCTTRFTDIAGRTWQYAAKHVGEYTGGLSEPFVFNDLGDLQGFLENVPDFARAALKTMVLQKNIDPWGCHPVKGILQKPKPKPKPDSKAARLVGHEPQAPKPQVVVDMTPPSGVGDLESVLEILQKQDSVRNADLRKRGWDGVVARDTLLRGVKSGKLAKHGTRGGTHYKLAA
jgi:hypothetical protein